MPGTQQPRGAVRNEILLPQTSVFLAFCSHSDKFPLLPASLGVCVPPPPAARFALPRSQSISLRGCVVAPAPQLLKTPRKYPKVPAWCAAAGREALACTHRQQAVFLLTGHANWLLVCTRGSPGAASCAGTPGGGRGGSLGFPGGGSCTCPPPQGCSGAVGACAAPSGLRAANPTWQVTGLARLCALAEAWRIK